MSIYKHYKGGLYEVMEEGTHTETGEKMVVYRDGKFQIWIRPAEMFYGNVNIDGKTIRRFEWVDKS